MDEIKYFKNLSPNEFKLFHCQNKNKLNKFHSESNLIKMSNSSSPDFSTLYEDQDAKLFNDTIFGSLKKKTLNDYDKELKNLKEENFNLKLRIYMLEEENSELTAKLEETKFKKRHVSGAIINSTSDEEDERKNDKFSLSLSDGDSTLVNQSFESLNDKKARNNYESNEEQKDEEIETLHEINQQLEENIENLKIELNNKENQIQEIMRKNEVLLEQAEVYKLDLERELYEKFSQQFENELNDKLDQAYQDFFLKEKSLQQIIDKLKESLDVKDEEINILKEYNSNSKNKDHLIEMMQSENTQKKAHSPNISANGTNENLHDEIVQSHIKSINQDLVESLKTHYQFIVSDLENQLQLKENLLQKYILIVKDKDYHINQLVNVNLLCNKEKSQHKLELFINDLRKNLNDKDELYEQFVINHFDLLKQKDNLIINLRSAQKQLHSDLNKANEILLESEDCVESLKNELQLVQNKNNSLINSLDLETKKNKELVADHQIEMEEKDQLIENLQNNQNSLKERLKKKNEKSQLTYFYEQQLEEKDLIINDLNEKVAKLTEKLNKNSEILDKNSDETLNLLTIENNQLKSSLSKLNLKLEQLEEDHIFRVDELEIEIDSLTKKLKEKENTIQNLVISAEEKDDLISKLKSNLLNENPDYSKQNKLEELLNKIKKKDEQIEELKTKLDKNRLKSTSMSDLPETSLTDSKLNNSLSNSFSNDNKFAFVLELLEKEKNIYQKLNSNKNKDINNYLNEIYGLRNQLLKQTVLRENRALSTISRFTSNENLVIQPNLNEKRSLFEAASPENTLTHDSGLNSQKSDSTTDSTLSQSKITRSFSTPKLTNSTSSLNSSKITEFTIKNYSKDELITHIQQMTNENNILKRQLDNKGPKVTEIHKENFNLREKLKLSEEKIDNLRKQLELYQITNGNAESLYEMAQKLNMTKEELEQYKQKLFKSKEKNSSNQNVSNLANCLSSKLSEVYSHHDSQNVPTKNIKITITTLERQIDDLKSKNKKLEDLYNSSERKARYLAIKLNKYSPYLNDLGLVKVNSLKKCLSEPKLNCLDEKQNLNDHELDKLVQKLLNDLPIDNSEISKIEQVQDDKFELINIKQLRNESLQNKLSQKDALIKEYYERLSQIYNGFRTLKAQSKYLKRLFGESLFQKLQADFSPDKISENLVHKIFSGALTKFEELSSELQEKRDLIERLEKELQELKSECEQKSTPSELSSCSQAKQTLNIEILDLSQKLKYYKDENKKLKEKIQNQNLEIEEAIQQLILYNKEKENTRLLLNEKKDYKVNKCSLSKNTLSISGKLNNTHAKLKTARNNIQMNIDKKTFK